MLERLEPHREALQILQTMPGIDRVAAASILAETGPDMSVFGSAQAFAAWAGLCPGNNETAGKRRQSATRKGSRHLRATLVEAAHAAANTGNCQFAGFKRSVAARRGNKRALGRNRAQDRADPVRDAARRRTLSRSRHRL